MAGGAEPAGPLAVREGGHHPIQEGGGCQIHNTICTPDLLQVLQEMKRQGHVVVAAAWQEANFTWTEFLPKANKVTYHA